MAMDSASTSLETEGPEPPEKGRPYGQTDAGAQLQVLEPEPRPFVVPGDGVTRALCATAHLKGDFADHVLGQLVEPAHRAMAPNWNIDTVALVRHATQAGGRRARRDYWLLVVYLGTLASLVLAFATMATDRLGMLTFVELVLVLPLTAYLLAFAIVWWHYSLIHQSALGVAGVPGFRDRAEEPAPLSPEVEQALIEADGANVVLFGGKDPFIGSGKLLHRWTFTVEIGTGVKGPDGVRAVPEPFDNAELHEALRVAIPEALNPRPISGHRLYVVGAHALAIGGLFRSGPVPDDPVASLRFRRPVPSVPDEVIKSYMRKPAQSARPYTFFELKAWDGQVVVTLFVRVVVTHPVLFVEMAVCALRPPQARFNDVATIRLGPGAHRLPVFRTVLPATLPLLLSSLGKQLRNVRGARADRLKRRDLEVDLAQRNDTNFSAVPSLREDIVRSENPLHFGYTDEEMFYRMFSLGAMDCLRDWLAERKVDLVDFDRQHASMVERVISNAQSLYGSGK